MFKKQPAITILCIFLFAALALLFTISNFITKESSLRSARPAYGTKKLRLVHIFFRHGMKTPDDTYPNDAYKNYSYYPFGRGQLTNIGKLNQYKIGEYLRIRYDEFLGPLPSPNLVFAQSTDVDRTFSSLAITLAALWPVKNSILEWNKNMNWFPIKIQHVPLEEDELLLPILNCPKYYEELDGVFEREEIQSIMNQNKDFFEKLSNITGMTVRSPDDVQSLYSTLTAQKHFGLPLPQWAEEYYPDKLVPLTELSFIINSYNDRMLRLYAGPIVKKTLDEWSAKSRSDLQPKERRLFIYGVHDWTVANILRAFKAWDPQIPDYGITVIFELYEDTRTREYGIEIYLRNSTSVDPYLLEIYGCGKYCPLYKVGKLMENIIPNNWKEECFNTSFKNYIIKSY